MITLLRLLRDHPNLVEADLSRFHQVRYSDRWRFDAEGCRRLTLREIWVRIQELPGDARIVKHYNGGRPRWDDQTYLIADLIQVHTGKAHPARPAPPKDRVDKRETPERARIRVQRVKRLEAKRAREMAGRNHTTA